MGKANRLEKPTTISDGMSNQLGVLLEQANEDEDEFIAFDGTNGEGVYVGDFHSDGEEEEYEEFDYADGSYNAEHEITVTYDANGRAWKKTSYIQMEEM